MTMPVRPSSTASIASTSTLVAEKPVAVHPPAVFTLQRKSILDSTPQILDAEHTVALELQRLSLRAGNCLLVDGQGAPTGWTADREMLAPWPTLRHADHPTAIVLRQEQRGSLLLGQGFKISFQWKGERFVWEQSTKNRARMDLYHDGGPTVHEPTYTLLARFERCSVWSASARTTITLYTHPVPPPHAEPNLWHVALFSAVLIEQNIRRKKAASIAAMT